MENLIDGLSRLKKTEEWGSEFGNITQKSWICCAEERDTGLKKGAVYQWLMGHLKQSGMWWVR